VVQVIFVKLLLKLTKLTAVIVKNSYISSCKKVEHGVLQGSVLGSLLFLLYINDITANVQGAKMVLFADDTNLLITGKDEFHLQHKVINAMKELEIWFQKIIF
jgi:hypothetical protein